MLSSVDLATRPELAVGAVDCRDDHRGWSAEPPREDVRLVLVRCGGFRRRARGVCADLDHVGYLGMSGEEEHFAHPAGGDRCTSITLTPALWRTVAGDAPLLDRSSRHARPRPSPAARAADPEYAATEALLGLVAVVVRQVVATVAPDGGRAGDRALTAQARAAIGDDHPAAAGLIPLAALLGFSPYRLSRAFTRELGVSLTRYRNRARAGPTGGR
ncbi:MULTISPECIES: AraC family transcriptional regulator [Amycolatopsis]|uniref:AraC family transcriptional regulator n=1 Tax=Amycolatopsis TaxID=1813 RepID=UPI0007E08128|nr:MULTISPECIES: AraC family transcriptional regulator [Amycolatopsis]OAP27482.1 hypothetical protein A4R44_01085 [Amycolatopsis sp. M39]